MKTLLVGKIIVDFRNELIGVNAVNHTGLLNVFAAGGGTAEAVHAHFKEKLCGAFVGIENVAYRCFFCDFSHCVYLLCVIVDNDLLYHKSAGISISGEHLIP